MKQPGNNTMPHQETHTQEWPLVTPLKIAVEAAAILDMVNNLVIWTSESRSLVAMVPPK